MIRSSCVSFGLLLGGAILATACTERSATNDNPKPYPRTTCPVTDEKLGSMGPPITVIKDGYEVKFCCQECVDKFNKHPEKIMEKVKFASKPPEIIK